MLYDPSFSSYMVWQLSARNHSPQNRCAKLVQSERVTVTELMTYKHRVERERTERSVEANERVVDDRIQKKLVYWKWGEKGKRRKGRRKDDPGKKTRSLKKANEQRKSIFQKWSGHNRTEVR